MFKQKTRFTRSGRVQNDIFGRVLPKTSSSSLVPKRRKVSFGAVRGRRSRDETNLGTVYLPRPQRMARPGKKRENYACA